MLDNEPEGGERPGAEPVGEAAEKAPIRRVRTTRRRTTPVVDPEVPVEATMPDEPALDEASPAQVLTPHAGETDVAPKSTRRRRKAASVEKPQVSGQEAEDGRPSAGEAEQSPQHSDSPAGAAQPDPVNATRTRRKQVEPPVTESFGGPTVVPSPVTGAEAATDAEPSGEARDRRHSRSAPTVLFMAPEPETPPTRRRAAAEPATAEPADLAVEEPEAGEPAEATRRRRRGRRPTEPAEEVEAIEGAAEAAEEAELAGEEADEDEDEEGAALRRRRRRGRRGRGRGKGPADEAEEEIEEPATAQVEEEEDEETEGGEGLTRRRRRRRRKGADLETEPEDGIPTVVRIREPRRTADEVQGVSGSTRLEAKRQRRRDGREQRRTRPPILTEAEFLARREAVDRVMVVRQRGDRTQIAVLEDGVLVEHYVTRAISGTMVGNVYLGKVQNVLPSMEAAFVDVGRGRNAVLYAGEVNWDSTGLEGRARSIEQALKSGDSVLVQVTKDPIGHKGARLTSHVALSGRHLVYVPHGNASGISRKLPDNERKRLRDILKKLVPDGAGVIVRTAAEGASEDELARDVKRLQAQWEEIQAKAAEGGAPVLLYEEPDLVIRVARDLFNEDFRELVVQGDEAYGMVESYLTHVSPDLVARLRRHTGVADAFAEKRIDEQILKALDRKVFLPSGGHLVIDRTEAMTVVDVNTGKYTGAGGNLEETVTRNNLEAAEEIVRQLRLRDLGGIVVIDFIDMVLESNRELVLRRLTECLGRDRTKHQVTEITSLGLVQMTRKRIGAGLLEAFSETCECCKGRGVIIHTEPVTEKPRAGGAGDKVKAVATATSTAVSPAPEPAPVAAGTRRRGRRGAAVEPVAAEIEVTEYEDTMGYDLSRYAETPAVTESQESAAEPSRLASADDPDAAYDLGGGDDDEGGAGGRRRSRRGGTRRRTHP